MAIELIDGSNVAVIGAGPAGSFASWFLLEMAERVGLRLSVDIYESKDFSCRGPRGCNNCGGIISESLVQLLATEGFTLPDNVVQRAIDAYVLHSDVGSVRIDTPLREMRIGAVHRGGGPLHSAHGPWLSFDGYLLEQALAKGARHLQTKVEELSWSPDRRPQVRPRIGPTATYDFLIGATGLNSAALRLYQELGFGYQPPTTVKTAIREFYLPSEVVTERFGSAMHVFFLDMPRLEFAALIPKGEFVTMCLLGEEVDQELVHAFLSAPEVRRCFPVDEVPCVCACSPMINVRGVRRPYADRLVIVGDSGVTRLYKDGIGASFRTAKAAATTAVIQGISADAFRKSYEPTCGAIAADNAIGHGMFAVSHLFKHVRFTRRAILRKTTREQARPDAPQRLSYVLWNMFTGSAPYREIFVAALHPGFVVGMLWNLVLSLRPQRKGREVADAAG